MLPGRGGLGAKLLRRRRCGVVVDLAGGFA